MGWAFRTPLLVFASCPLFLVLMPRGLAGAPLKPTLQQIESKVYCLCGCATTLNRCPDAMTCQMHAQEVALIRMDIQKGKSEPAILQDLVDRYGIRVLAAPPAKGFNLAAWILPGLGLIVGFLVVVLIVRRLRKRAAADFAKPEAPPVDPRIMAAVDEEMNRVAPMKE